MNVVLNYSELCPFRHGCTTTKYTQKNASIMTRRVATIEWGVDEWQVKWLNIVSRTSQLDPVLFLHILNSHCSFEYKSAWIWLVLEAADILKYRNRLQADTFQAWLTQQPQAWSTSRAKMGWNEPSRVRVKPAGLAHHYNHLVNFDKLVKQFYKKSYLARVLLYWNIFFAKNELKYCSDEWHDTPKQQCL